MDIQAIRDHAAVAAVQHGAPSPPAPSSTPAPATSPASAASPGELAQAVKHINQAIKSISPGIEFSIDEDVHTTVVKVVDVNTKEVLRQMPSAETLQIARTIDKLQGLLIKQQA